MDRLRRRLLLRAGRKPSHPRYAGPRPARRRKPATVRRTTTGGHIRDIVRRVERKRQRKSRWFATAVGISLLLAGTVVTVACAIIKI